ncbi:MAG: VWA domain-containing protein, partial [Moraxellaceae bacterium]
MNKFQQRFLLNGLAASVVIAMGAIYINQYPWRELSPEVAVISESGQIGVLDRTDLSALQAEQAVKSEASPLSKEKADELAENIRQVPAAPEMELKLSEPATIPPSAITSSNAKVDKTVADISTSTAVANAITTASQAQIPAPTSITRAAEKKAAPASAKPSADIMARTIGENKAAAMNTPVSVADAATLSAPKEFRDRFETFKENTVTAVATAPVSTFSIDVDTAAYSFARRQLNSGVLPAKDAVRLEEMVNYFPYNYPVPESKKIPFKPSVTLLDSPFKAGNKLVHIGIKGYQIPSSEIPRSNLVFLLDVSGSMNAPDKLPLVQQSMSVLLESLKPDDTVAIVIYAGAAGTVLNPTAVKDKTKILAAINNLQPGGATAGAEGIALA